MIKKGYEEKNLSHPYINITHNSQASHSHALEIEQNT